MTRFVRSLLTGVGLSLLTSGCALTSKSDSVILRYFALDDARSHAVPPPSTPSDQAKTAPLQLRLGRVNAATYLKDRIAFRDSNEVGYYDDLRWTEKPESYVRRALARAFFEDRGIKQIISGFGPTLEVELGAFEEIRGEKHAVRVEMTWLLRDEQLASTQQTFVIERPLRTTKDVAAPADIASALSGALDEAVQRIVTQVTASLVP
ncbi:MAG: ABC-type transport auxiliary lipoprotein family protein [Polyangiaceae bacterium]